MSIAFIYAFGFGNFLIFLLISVALGMILLAIFWKNMLEFQILSPKEMFAQFGFIICAFLFIIPGVLSSFVAFLILLFCLILKFKPQQKEAFKANNTSNSQQKYKDEEIIDVEIIKD
ncbi:integral memnbrane protein [Campylobacter sp. MIT 99-7217]|nr:integral memnbrane protein [Campylobacter sp. MIT 99-7217]